jgi:hypothetical protein
MLFSAVSPEIRHRESKMRDISIGTDDDDLIDMNVEVVDVPIKIIALEILLGVCNFSPDLNLIINKHF